MILKIIQQIIKMFDKIQMILMMKTSISNNRISRLNKLMCKKVNFQPPSPHLLKTVSYFRALLQKSTENIFKVRFLFFTVEKFMFDFFVFNQNLIIYDLESTLRYHHCRELIVFPSIMYYRLRSIVTRIIQWGVQSFFGQIGTHIRPTKVSPWLAPSGQF